MDKPVISVTLNAEVIKKIVTDYVLKEFKIELLELERDYTEENVYIVRGVQPTYDRADIERQIKEAMMDTFNSIDSSLSGDLAQKMLNEAFSGSSVVDDVIKGIEAGTSLSEQLVVMKKAMVDAYKPIFDEIVR